MAKVAKKRVAQSPQVVGKGTLALSESVKRELYNEDGAPTDRKKQRKNDEEWINVGRLGFYLEIPKKRSESDLIEQLKSQAGKRLSVTPHDDSCNPMAVRVGIPGRRYDTIWKYGGDAFLSKFLSWSRRTKCEAEIIPTEMEVLDDPKRKTFWLVPVDVHFFLHRDIDILNQDKDVKRQVMQLRNYMRGGTQPNPAKYAWPIVRRDIADECCEKASLLDRLMKKKTAKDWWKDQV